MTLRPVAIFDAELPPAVAFVRSLGRAGVPRTVYSHLHDAAARRSRFTKSFRACPDVAATDDFVDWLTEAMRAGEIDLVAPTSDPVAFCVAEAHERLGRKEDGHPSPAAVRDCLFKDLFADRIAESGFPTAPCAAPATPEEALAIADSIGYPVVLKPRSHVGVGLARGTIARSPTELADLFVRYEVPASHSAATRHNADLGLPIVQRYLDQDEIDIVSVSGCLDGEGRLLALGHCRKLRAWPPGLGVGTRFEAVGEQPFTQRAVDAVRGVLGSGLFELEVLVHRPTGATWTIDLNPRAYGQISLEVARGNDLPLRWYEAVSGLRLDGSRPHRRRPRYWQAGVPFYVGALVGMAIGPDRSGRLREFAAATVEPRVGAFLDWRDPGPAIVGLRRTLRHPGGLVRPFLRHRDDVERNR